MRRHLVPVLLLLCLGVLMNQPPRKIGEVGEGLTLASVSPDGKLCAGLRQDGSWSFVVFEVASGKERFGQKLPDGPASFNPFAWSADSATLVVGTGEQVLVLDKNFQRVRKLKADWMVRDVRFSGSVLMARCDHAVLLYEMPGGKMFYRQAQQRLLAARLSPDARYLALASYEEPIFVFDVKEKRVVQQLKAGPVTINLEFCRNSEWLACGFRFRDQRDKDLALVYDWRNARMVGDFLGQRGIMGFAVAQDGSRLLARGLQETRVWDVATSKLLCLRTVDSQVMDALSADGRMAASVPVGRNQAVVWHTDDGRDGFTLETRTPPTGVSFPGPGLVGVTAGSQSVYQLP